MRVALVHRDLHAVTRGGIGTLYRALAPRLRDAGHEVALITQHTPDPLALKGIRVFTLPRTDDLDIHRQTVDQTLTALRPDVVESSSWEAETLHYARRPATKRAPVVVRGDLTRSTCSSSWPRRRIGATPGYSPPAACSSSVNHCANACSSYSTNSIPRLHCRGASCPALAWQSTC
jgi:hypothetical protein